MQELDRLNKCDFEIYDQLYSQLKADKKEQKAYGQINVKYIMKSYGFSLILTSAMIFLSYWANDDDYMPLLIASFILYPFARIIFDVLLGFKFDYKIKKQSFVMYYVYQFRFFIQLLIYFLSLFLAPFGILYLILRTITRAINKRKN